MSQDIETGEGRVDEARLVTCESGIITALDGEVIPPKRERGYYSAPEAAALGECIRVEREAGEKSLKEAAKHFRKVGEILRGVKARLDRGHFAYFLKTSAKIHPRMAQRYMLLSRSMDKLSAADATRVSRLSLRDALDTLVGISGQAA
jgi:hypothetical protein